MAAFLKGMNENLRADLPNFANLVGRIIGTEAVSFAEIDGLDSLSFFFEVVDHGGNASGALGGEFFIGLGVAGRGGVTHDEEEGIWGRCGGHFLNVGFMLKGDVCASAFESDGFTDAGFQLGIDPGVGLEACSVIFWFNSREFAVESDGPWRKGVLGHEEFGIGELGQHVFILMDSITRESIVFAKLIDLGLKQSIRVSVDHCAFFGTELVYLGLEAVAVVLGEGELIAKGIDLGFTDHAVGRLAGGIELAFQAVGTGGIGLGLTKLIFEGGDAIAEEAGVFLGGLKHGGVAGGGIDEAGEGFGVRLDLGDESVGALAYSGDAGIAECFVAALAIFEILFEGSDLLVFRWLRVLVQLLADHEKEQEENAGSHDNSNNEVLIGCRSDGG